MIDNSFSQIYNKNKEYQYQRSEKMLKRMISFAAAAVLFAFNALPGGLPDFLESDTVCITAQADDSVIINGDSISIFSQRTKQSVSKKYAQAVTAGASYHNNKPETYYRVQASLTSPYHQGVLSNDTLARVQGLVDFYRWLTGVKPLTEKSTQNEELQYQTLDRNFEFCSFISNSSKPADMPQELWDKGFNSSFSLLMSGASPQDAMLSYINEGYYPSSEYWSSLSNRRTLLNARLSGIQFGYCGKVFAARCSYDYDAGSDLPFYAFPSPGYIPSDCIRPYSAAWSVDLDTSKLRIADTSKVVIKVTNTKTGKSYQCTNANSKAKIYTNSLAFAQPSDYDTSTNKYTDDYKVVITGLTDTASGKSAQLKYTVRFIDHAKYAASDIAHAGFDFSTIAYYKGNYPDTDSLKKLGAAIPKTITITNEFGVKARIPTDGSWKYDKKKNCWYNSAVNAQLPERFTDTKGKLKRIEIACKGDDSEYYKHNELNVEPRSTTCGGKATFEVLITILYFDQTILSHVGKDANGNYFLKKSFNSQTSSNFYKKTNERLHYYDIDTTAEDSGEYISFYFSSDRRNDTAYASTSPVVLNVKHKYSSKFITKPCCTEKGTIQYTCSCGKSYTKEAAPTGHDWNIKSCKWKQSGEGQSCTITAVCKNDSSHTFSKTVKASYSVTKQPTCTQNGVGTYTAKFSSPDIKPQIKTVVISATGHSWGQWQTSGFDVKKGTRLITHRCIKCGGKETKPVKNEVKRFAGANRYSTAAVISKSSFDSSKTVILSSGSNFADALAGVPLAVMQNAPIILTTKDTIPDESLAEIKRLGAKKVLILGGKRVISADIEKALRAQGIKTQRIAGATRFGTATAIANKITKKPTDIFFVYAFNYADALSVSTAAALKNAPIIYLNTNGELDADTKAYLAKLKASGCVKNAYVIGGEGVISKEMLHTAADALGIMPTRLSGIDRYETCTAVNKAFKNLLNGSMLCIATGCDFPDALSGGVYAALNRAPLFMENSKQKALSLSKTQTMFLKGKKPLRITIFGGTGAVPDSHAQTIADNCV